MGSKRIFIVIGVCAFLVVYFFSFLSSQKPGTVSGETLKIAQPDDKYISNLRELHKQHREYDLKLDDQGYPHGYITDICCSEKQNLMAASNEGILFISNDGIEWQRASMSGVKAPQEKIYHIAKDDNKGVFLYRNRRWRL